ncbi:Hint domain-containing protein [Thalassobium sp. R2A62]|uniref:Hint domain-containing protein n=1 Tax=Thalassobium sp. R2A62 TaxID=633131 RepID=UPI0001B1D3EF|nr:type I secretion target repeat protein [Thalassobium sp. R2A62]
MPVYEVVTFLAPKSGSFTFDAGSIEVLRVEDPDATFGDNSPAPPEGYSNQIGQNDVLGFPSAGSLMTGALYSFTNTATGEVHNLPYVYNPGEFLWSSGFSSSLLWAMTNPPLVDGATYTISSVSSDGTTAWTDFAPVCFTSGTRIATVSGDRRIEDLVAGDLVLTMDRGYQPIRWIGSSKVPATGDFAPILIRKGALGNDRDLRVSPQHRMLLQGWQAEMLFGELEVLATAKSLLNDQTILRDEGGEVEYFHMLFDSHEIIWAEGARSESFHPGQQGWTALDQATRDEILTLFPQLADGTLNDYGPAARMSLKHKEGKLLGSYMAGSC